MVKWGVASDCWCWGGDALAASWLQSVCIQIWTAHLFFYDCILFAEHAALHWLCGAFCLCLNALSTFSTPNLWLKLAVILTIWGRKEQQSQCNCNPCTSSDDLLFSVPSVHTTHQWLKNTEAYCAVLRPEPIYSINHSFGKRKSLRTSLATTYKNTFSLAIKAILHLFRARRPVRR